MTLRNGVLLIVIFLAVGAADAHATFRIVNQLEPAGDPTKITYRIESPNSSWKGTPFEIELDYRDPYRSMSPPPGPPPGQDHVASAVALLPPGWVVGDIQCTGPPNTSDFLIDVPNGRVTLLRHGPNDEHICTFTNRRASLGSSLSSPGVSPMPLTPTEAAKVALPQRPALVGVRAGRRYAEGTVRLIRRSVVKAWLLRRGKRVGRTREVLKPGTHDVRVALQRKRVKRWRRRGLEQVTLTLRIAVTERRTDATHVFKHRVIVKL